MKSFFVLLLISYIFTADPPTSVTLDLESTQSLTTSSTQVTISVTADQAMSLTVLTNLVLQSSSTTIPLTCSFSPAVECTAGTAKEGTCTFTSALTAGSYQLNVADSQTISMTATYNDGTEVQAVPNTVIPAVSGTPTSITVSAAVVNNDPPTSVTLDLKATQTLTTSSTQVTLSVTADKVMSLSALTNLVLKSATSTTIELTCSFSPAVSCTAGSPTDATCTVASLTAGTYQLAVADTKTISMTATYNDGTSDQAVSVTPTVATTPTSITVPASNVDNNDPPTSVTLDLKASQTLTVGTEGSVIIKVTADKAMSLTALSNLILQSTETASTTIALTCTFTTPVSCTANTAKEVTCKVAAPATAGTYKLAAAADKSISMTATYGSNSAAVSGVTPAVAATPTTLTVSTASNNDNTNTNTNANSENDDDNSSFLKFSYIIFFIAFLF